MRIEVDPTWIAVLLLTREMMKGENLYFFDKQDLKLVDNARMNKLIKSYPGLAQKLGEIGPYSFPKGMDQEHQTRHFLKTIGIEVKEVEGVCCERGVAMEVEDEI